MADDPTNRELLLRLENIAKTQESTTARLDEMVRTLEDRYVPRREFDLRVGEVEKDSRDQAGFRRQITAGVLLLLLGLVANIVLNLSRIPGGGS